MWWSYFLCRCGGTVGAILTCPLEVVKTRLQSSSVTLYISEVHLNTVNGASVNRVTRVSPGPLHCLKWVYVLLGFGCTGEGGGEKYVGQISMKYSDSYICHDATEMTFLSLLFNCKFHIPLLWLSFMPEFVLGISRSMYTLYKSQLQTVSLKLTGNTVVFKCQTICILKKC